MIFGALANILPEMGLAHDFTKKHATLLDDFIKKQITFVDIPGASLALIKNGKVIYSQVYGVSNAPSGMPVIRFKLIQIKKVYIFLLIYSGICPPNSASHTNR